MAGRAARRTGSGGSAEELLRTRARFLAECGWGSEPALRSSLERRDRQLLDALRDGAEVVLWFEHDLYDQLQLIDALALARSVDAAPELIVIGAFPGRPSFAGLGELTANELETLWPSRTRATPEALEAAAQAWSAFCAPEPTAIAELATQETRTCRSSPPRFAGCSKSCRRRPTGCRARSVSRSSRSQRAHDTAPAAFVAAQRLEDAPFLGDTWFFRTLSALGQGENRLVEGDGAALPPPPPLTDGQTYSRLELRVTAAGERVLRGEADRVELLGHRPLGRRDARHARTVWRWDRRLRLACDLSSAQRACSATSSSSPGRDAFERGRVLGRPHVPERDRRVAAQPARVVPRHVEAVVRLDERATVGFEPRDEVDVAARRAAARRGVSRRRGSTGTRPGRCRSRTPGRRARRGSPPGSRRAPASSTRGSESRRACPARRARGSGTPRCRACTSRSRRRAAASARARGR